VALGVEESRPLGAWRCINTSSRGEMSFFANGRRSATSYICRFAAATIRRVCNAKHLKNVISCFISFLLLFMYHMITLPYLSRSLSSPYVSPFLSFSPSPSLSLSLSLSLYLSLYFFSF